MKNDTKALNRYGMNEITAAKQLTHEVAVDNINDPNATFGEKFVAGASGFFVYMNPFVATAQGIETGLTAFGNTTGWWGFIYEVEPAPLAMVRFLCLFNHCLITPEPHRYLILNLL